MELADVGFDVSKDPAKIDGVKLQLRFNRAYHTLGSSLDRSELGGLPDDLLAGDKITLYFDRPRSGVIMFSAQEKADDEDKFSLHTLVFQPHPDNLLEVVEIPETGSITERWVDLQHLDHTLYMRVGSSWYVGEPTIGEVSSRLRLEDYRLVNVTTLLRYVFEQVGADALASSHRRINQRELRRREAEQLEEARRDERIRIDKELQGLRDYFGLFRQIAGRLRDWRGYRKIPSNIRKSLDDEKNFTLGDPEVDLEKPIGEDVDQFLGQTDKRL